MRPTLRASFLGLTLTLALAATAQAEDHLMRVTEVFPSASAPGMAFVELQDPQVEPFPSLSYTVAAHDQSDTVIGQQVFGPPYLWASTQPFLLGAAERQPQDARLTIRLPTAGKVCFYHGTGTGSTPIYCLPFEAVPEGRSAQLTESNTVVFACPTPDAPNRQTADTCAGSTPPPASTPPPPSTPPPAQPTPVSTQPASTPAQSAPAPAAAQPTGSAALAADNRAPRQVVSARRAQGLGRLRMSVQVDERATVTVSGSIAGAARKLALVKLSRVAAAGARTVLALKLNRRDSSAARRALRRGRRLTATLKITARDTAGNVATTRLRIILKP